VRVRAEAATLSHRSAHADADEIMAWLRSLATPPRRTFITHGDPAAADALRLRIERDLGWPCKVPYDQEAIELA
jgi:metallo-beta-lactamase family protein